MEEESCPKCGTPKELMGIRIQHKCKVRYSCAEICTKDKNFFVFRDGMGFNHYFLIDELNDIEGY